MCWISSIGGAATIFDVVVVVAVLVFFCRIPLIEQIDVNLFDVPLRVHNDLMVDLISE